MAGIGIGGMPTDVDVERLRQEIGVPEPGILVPYARLEKIIGVPRTKSRFKSVVIAWIKRLDRENNVSMKAVPNQGYEARSNHARVDFGGRLYKRGLKRIGKAALLAIRTERRGLDEGEVRQLDHLVLMGGQLRTMAATAARELRCPDPDVKRLTAGGSTA